MSRFIIILSTGCLLLSTFGYAQHSSETTLPDKIEHAEPLYIDLIRDLGARKGEREWNLGFGINDNLTFDNYEALIEYEFAVIDRLGLEVEVPFIFYTPMSGISPDSIPNSKAESLKLAAQWSFLVKKEWGLSMALGYINELEFSSFKNFGNPLFKGNIFNPFLVVAKRLGANFHSLIYTGPQVKKDFKSSAYNSTYELNTNIHYVIADTRNFIGIEFNKYFADRDFDMTIRPQMRLSIFEDLLAGLVVGIPVAREQERFSMFVRIIWEPHE